MPELPDVDVYVEGLRRKLSGRVLQATRLGNPFLLRSVAPPLTDADGRTVVELRRIGKRIAIGVDNGLWLVLHLMIAGRLHWHDDRPALAAKNRLAAFDFEHGSLLLTEAGTKKRASLTVVAGDAALAALDPGGAEPLDAMQVVLTDWRTRLLAEAGGELPVKVTAFRPDMQVHGRFGKPCRACGAPVQRIRYKDNETNYCARCQTGSRILKDRSLSRLLKADWPASLDSTDYLTHNPR